MNCSTIWQDDSSDDLFLYGYLILSPSKTCKFWSVSDSEDTPHCLPSLVDNTPTFHSGYQKFLRCTDKEILEGAMKTLVISYAKLLGWNPGSVSESLSFTLFRECGLMKIMKLFGLCPEEMHGLHSTVFRRLLFGRRQMTVDSYVRFFLPTLAEAIKKQLGFKIPVLRIMINAMARPLFQKNFKALRNSRQSTGYQIFHDIYFRVPGRSTEETKDESLADSSHGRRQDDRQLIKVPRSISTKSEMLYASWQKN